MRLVQYLEVRLATLREQRRNALGPITNGTYRLDGMITATEHDLTAARAAERGQL